MTRRPDLDLMQLADGELDAADAAELEASLDAGARAKLTALGDVREIVRGHLELRADEADARLAGMWDEIDKQLALAAAPAPAATKAKAAPADAPRRGLWARFAGWLDDHRGNVLTGLISAGAVAGLMLWLRPAGGKDTTVVIPGHGPDVTPVVLKRQAPQVETLDTPEGSSGNVFTVEDEDGSATVILVTPDDSEGT